MWDATNNDGCAYAADADLGDDVQSGGATVTPSRHRARRSGLLGMPSVLLTASARGLHVQYWRARGLMSSIRSIHY